MMICAEIMQNDRESIVIDELVGRGFLSTIAADRAVVSARGIHAAEAKPAWQGEWEKVLAAAKKEGQVAVYISGYEEILPEFQKEYPEIKVLADHGPWLPGRPAFARRAARRKVLGRRGQRRRRDNLSATVSRQGLRSDQAGVASCPRSTTLRSGTKASIITPTPENQYIFDYVGYRDLWLDQLQHQVSQREGFQILLGSAQRPSGKGKSFRATFACRAPARATRDCFTTCRTLDRRLFGNCMERWT